jgi:hypothetical protein
MNQRTKPATALWWFVGIVSLLRAMFAFLHDIFRPDWPAWVGPPVLIVGFSAAIAMVRRDSLAKYALCLAALLSTAFIVLYVILDAVLDIFVVSDVFVAVVTSLVVVGLWSLLSGAVAAEEV